MKQPKTINGEPIQDLKLRALTILSRHVGKNRAIPMRQLHEAIFGMIETGRDAHGAMRATRTLIKCLKDDGVNINGNQSPATGGYFMSNSDSEESDSIQKDIKLAKYHLWRAYSRKRRSMAALTGQLMLELRKEMGNEQ